MSNDIELLSKIIYLKAKNIISLEQAQIIACLGLGLTINQTVNLLRRDQKIIVWHVKAMKEKFKCVTLFQLGVKISERVKINRFNAYNKHLRMNKS